MFIQKLCNPYLQVEISVMEDSKFREVYGACTNGVNHGPHWVVIPEYLWVRVQAAVSGNEGCRKYLGTLAHEITHALDLNPETEQPQISNKYSKEIWSILSPYAKSRVKAYPPEKWEFEALGWLMNDKPKLAEFIVGCFYDPEPRPDYREWALKTIEMLVS